MRQVAVIAAVFVASFVMFGRADSAKAEAAPKTNSKPVVVVKSGDSLDKIAKRQKTTWTRIYNANTKVKDPDLIYPGDKLRIPKADEKLPDRIAQGSKVTDSPKTYSAPKTSYKPNYRSVSQPARPVVNGSVWDRLAACESGGNWAINTGNGYYGGVQFSLATWRGVGGQGYPHQASKAEQIKRAQILQARSGWGQWPACTAKLGLR